MRKTGNNADWELMERLALGDEKALAELVYRWDGPLRAFFFRQVGKDLDEVEDLTQEAFWRVYRQRARVRRQGAFSSWIFRIAFNLSIDHIRLRSRRILAESLDSDFQECNPRAESSMERPDRKAMASEAMRKLEQGLLALPEKQRAALILCRLEGLSHAEAAISLECSAKAVESLVARARKSLADYMKDCL